MRILLVEDDSMIGEAIRDALMDASYAARWVPTSAICWPSRLSKAASAWALLEPAPSFGSRLSLWSLTCRPRASRTHNFINQKKMPLI